LKLRDSNFFEGNTLGKITCNWPHRLMIVESSDNQDIIGFIICQSYDENNYIKTEYEGFITSHASANLNKANYIK